MQKVNSQSISEFIAETEPYIQKLDSLPLGTAAELYDMLEAAAFTATLHINEIDPELRVDICDKQDRVLERIIDELPPFQHSGERMKIFSPAIQGYRRWDNVELLKDCGLAGYMLANEIGADPVMFFGTKPSDYPYLSVLPGMEMLYSEVSPGEQGVYYDHLENSFPEMDILILHGMYNQSTEYLKEYRMLRPDGKVYCSLDMNDYWMNNTPWDSPNAIVFSQQCDIVATTCRQMRDSVNRNPKVHFSCRWLTNGFYNPTGIPVTADAEIKENVILSVGRIGTKQKNNEELMTAFAGVSEALSGWSLRFIGPVLPDFQSYIDNYFTENPHLKDRVFFTGPISKKTDLYSEYSRAKILAFSSRQEGFPNVYAEALFHGCMFVTSDIDSADDMTNYGELGAKYTLGDIDALQRALVETCARADKQGMQAHIPKALAYATKYYDWNRIAKKLSYMLFK